MGDATDDDLAAAVDKAATIMLGQELDGARKEGDPFSRRARAAAVEICRRAGILEVLKAISADGELRPPPPWPQADIVPVGGGTGFLDVEVRTYVAGAGIRSVPLRIGVPEGKRTVTQDQIADAFGRGRFYLAKLVG